MKLYKGKAIGHFMGVTSEVMLKGFRTIPGRQKTGYILLLS